MKLFYAKVGTQVVNINGTRVKFDNCIAEVEDAFGEEALALGLPGLYEDGTQPAFQTPREVALQASAADREEFLNKVNLKILMYVHFQVVPLFIKECS